jgi:3-hydroxyisobutyrate dehydrogenase-like beta-hydroxyacid dehydrogenase
MGISIAASARRAGNQVYWASEGRSPATRERAGSFGLEDAGRMADLCARCSILISICPPHAAEAVAQAARACAFGGLYLDANAIAPERARCMDQAMRDAGIAFVDGGIIGGPAWQPDRTWLYLSGPRASEIAACFSAGPLMTQVLDEAIGTASALKMCFAAYSKGTTALLCAVLAAAESLGVREALDLQWARDDAGFPGQAAGRVQRVTGKAWRFAGEMEEIAATFRAAGMPGDFHAAAATLYRRMARFKDRPAPPELQEVLAALTQESDEPDR